jgi:hypothetical protein
MFAKILYWGYGEDKGGVAIYADDDHAEGWGGATWRRFR